MGFQRNIEQWMNQKRQHKSSSTVSTSDVIDNDTTSLLDDAKQEALSHADAPTMAGLSMNEFRNKMGDVEDIVKNLQESCEELQNLCSNQPEYYEEKESLDEAIDNLQKLTKEDTKEPDNVRQQLASFLDPEQIDSFLDENTFFKKEHKGATQRVNEIRDRYYTIDSTPSDGFDISEDTKSVEFIDKDTGEKIEDVEGYSGSEITPDGNIVLTSEQGSQKELEITPTEEQRIHGKHDGVRKNAKDSINNLQDEFEYEAWACLATNTVELINEQWQDMVDNIRESIAMLNVPQKMLDNQYFPLEVDNKILQDAVDIKDNFHGLAQFYTDPEEQLGFVEDIGNRPGGARRPGASTLCDFNKDKYCNISEDLETLSGMVDQLEEYLIDQIDEDGTIEEKLEEWESFQIDLTEQITDVTEFLNELSSNVDKLEEPIGDLKTQLCSIITHKIPGIPKALQVILPLLSEILQGLSLLPVNSFQDKVDEWGGWYDWPEALRKSGLDAVADDMARGDIKSLMEKTEENSSYASQVADNLREKRDESNFVDVAAEYNKLVRSAESFGEQEVVGQIVRERVRQRLSSDRSLRTAEHIEEREAQL